MITQFECEAGDLVFEFELAIHELRAGIGEYLRAQRFRERCGIAAVASDGDCLVGQREASCRVAAPVRCDRKSAEQPRTGQTLRIFVNAERVLEQRDFDRVDAP